MFSWKAKFNHRLAGMGIILVGLWLGLQFFVNVLYAAEKLGWMNWIR